MGGVLEGLSGKLDRFRRGFLPPIPVDVPVLGVFDCSIRVTEDKYCSLLER
jgi:hypothetical protein